MFTIGVSVELSGGTPPSVSVGEKRLSAPALSTQYNDNGVSDTSGLYSGTCPKCAMSDYEWSDDSDSSSSSSSTDLEETIKKRKKRQRENGKN